MNYFSIIFAITFLSTTSLAQNPEKMKKHLKVTFTDQFDKTASVSFDHLIPGKHGFDKISSAFKNAFVSKKFTISDSSQYVLTMDYKYGYAISQYRMQYSNLTAQILDLAHNKAIVATIVYDGRFELEPVAEAVAVELEKAENPKLSETSNPEKLRGQPAKSKEDKLVELKNLYDKQLITKEEYEREKAKVLSEN